MRAFLVAAVVVWVGIAEAAPPPRPAELVASLAVEPASLAGIKAYVDAVSPGVVGGMIDPTQMLALVGVPPAGVDVKKPLYFLLAQLGGAPSFVVAAKVGDAKALSSAKLAQKVAGGWVVLGPQTAVDAIGPWALAAIPATPTLRATTITLYTARLGDLVKLLAPGSASGATNAAKFQAFAGDADQLDIRIEATVDLATIEVTAVPRAGTRLQQLVAAQRPSDFALAGKLPAMSIAMLAAGRIAAGPYRDELRELATDIFATGNTDKTLHDAILAAVGGAGGELALGVSVDRKRGSSGAFLFGVDDSKAVETAFGTVLTAIGKGLRVTAGKKPFETWTVDTLRPYDGVALRGFKRKFDTPTTPEEQRRVDSHGPAGREDNAFGIVATPGEPTLGLLASGSDGAAQAARVIDALRGKAPRLTLTRTAAQLVEHARVRRDSFVFVLDGGALAVDAGVQTTDEATFALSAGASDGALRVRVLAPAVSTTSAIGMWRAYEAMKNATP